MTTLVRSSSTNPIVTKAQEIHSGFGAFFLFVVGVVMVCVWLELSKIILSYASKSTFYLH